VFKSNRQPDFLMVEQTPDEDWGHAGEADGLGLHQESCCCQLCAVRTKLQSLSHAIIDAVRGLREGRIF
jgi:hypothetical protein